MSDMTLKWEAHDKNVVSELEKMNKAMDQLREQNRKLSEESKKHHDESHGWLQEQVRDITTMAASYITVEKAVEVVSDVYREWIEIIDDAGKKHRQFTQDLIRDVTLAGDAAKSDEIREFTKHGPGTQEQREAAYAGIRASLPEASLDRVLQIAAQVAVQAPSGIDMREAGAAAGTLARFAPGKSAGDIADISVALRNELRGGDAKLTDDSFMRGVGNLVDSGAMSFEGALGMGAAAVSKNMKLNFMAELGQLATASVEDLTKDIKPGQVLTEDQVRRSQLAGMTGQERVAAVMGDHQMAVAGLSEQGAYTLGRLPGSDIRRWDAMLVDAQRQNVGARFTGADTEVGKEAIARQALEMQKQELEHEIGPTRALVQMGRESRSTGAYQRYGMAGYVMAGAESMVSNLTQFAGGNSARNEEIRNLQSESWVDPEVRQLLREHTEALKQNTRARGGVNIDSQTERASN